MKSNFSFKEIKKVFAIFNYQMFDENIELKDPKFLLSERKYINGSYNESLNIVKKKVLIYLKIQNVFKKLLMNMEI